MTLVAPTALANRTTPPAPTPTVTRLGMIWPAPKLRFEALGRGAPPGYTVRNDSSVASTTVTFITTAEADAGTPDAPVTTRSRSAPATSLLVHPPAGPRESRTRTGTMLWNPAAGGATLM